MEIGQGTVVSMDFRITHGDMDAFRALSGDTTPIHDESDYPCRRGFAGALVDGEAATLLVRGGRERPHRSAGLQCGKASQGEGSRA
jgi:acyl dehydratase